MASPRWIRRLAVGVVVTAASALVAAACGPPPPVFADVSTPERAGAAVFTVNLPPGTQRPLSLLYVTADGTARRPDDYAFTNGTLTFEAGESSKTVSVPVVDDALDENDEHFRLDLFSFSPSNPGGFVLEDQAMATVVDDDPPPTVTLARRPTFVEGNSGTSGGGDSFRLDLSAPSGHQVAVDFGTADGSGTAPRATAPADYKATATRAIFAPGTTSVSVPVPIVGDTLDEAREAFTATLSNPANASLGTVTQAPGFIADDDDPPSVIIGDASVLEGDALTFRVRLSAPSGRPTSVAFAAGDGTAEQPEDYVATAGTLRWTSGTTTEWTVSVPTAEDGCREGNESMLLNLGTPENLALPDSSGVGTIRNDDLASC